MENVSGQFDPQMPPVETPKTPRVDLPSSLEAWVNERPRILYKERGVRQDVAYAIITDIFNPLNSPDIPQKLQDYRKNVDGALSATIDSLNKQAKGENGTIKRSQTIKDHITGTKFFTKLRREGTSWISEEINEDSGETISRAEIGDGGVLKLTLNYSGQRYEERGANPKLESALEYPTGTKTLFLKHAASLGVISWKGKFLLE